MIKALSWVCAAWLCMALPGAAQDWQFRYGPSFGGTPLDSYTQVESGRNTLAVHALDSRSSIAASVLIENWEMGEQFKNHATSGGPLELSVLKTDGSRYARGIAGDDYVSQYRDNDNRTLVMFLLRSDDLFAMADANAVFVVADGLQFRFGTVGAAIALRSFIDAMRETQ